MAGKKFATAWGWCLVVAVGWNVDAAPAVAQERIEIGAESALPLPLQSSARWLRLALLAPLQKAQLAKEEAKTEEPSPQVQAIEGLQQQLGGSVVRGKVFDDAAPVDKAELRRVLTDIEQRQLRELPHSPPQVCNWQRVSPGANVQYAQPLDPVQAATEQLRSSARNLDSLAADLEEGGKYKEADRLRASAQKLRREARTFDR